MARIVGIDLGSYSVKVVRLEPKGRGGFEVLKYDQALVPSSEGETATLRQRQAVALAELKEKGLLEGDVFVTGLPGDAAAVRTLRFPFADPKKIAEVLPFSLEGEIPLDLDDIVISWSILGTVGKARKDKAGETEVLVAWAKKDAVAELLALLAEVGVDPRHVQFDALAMEDLHDHLWRADSEGPRPAPTSQDGAPDQGGAGPDPATAVVDVGHRKTTVCVLAEGRVVSAHTILHGGADATRALSRAIGLPLGEAERGKRKEAFIEVDRAQAQFPEQQQISEVLKASYAPILRRLRQIFQATISSARVRVEKVILVGGGSRVLNLDHHMAEELHVQVVRGRESDAVLKGQLSLKVQDEGAPEAALALAYAVSAVQASRPRARVDFRTGTFAWKGDFEFLRERASTLVAWAAALLLLFGASGVARAFVLGKSEEDLVQQELKLCKEITGDASESFTRCLALIQERIQGQSTFSVPERSAADMYMEIALRLPPPNEVRRKITELDVSSERIKLRGLTASYEAIDTMVERLQGGRCFSMVEKGKAQNKGADVEFNITITLDCVASPGDGKILTPPAGATPAASRAPIPMESAVGSPREEVAPRLPTVAPRISEDPPLEGELSPSDEAKRAGRLTPEEIQNRRDRLKKLREERETRRLGRMGADGSLPKPNMRALSKQRGVKPAGGTSEEGVSPESAADGAEVE